MSIRFTDALITRILQEAENGSSEADICRKQNCPEQPFYRREVEFGGMDVPDANNS